MTALCECGCGQAAPIAARTDTRDGAVKGRPKRFINGHNNGSPAAVPYPRRVQFRPLMAGLATPCWRPLQKPERNGYVRVTDQGCSRYAHILMWEDVNGPVPDGLELDHLCRNRWCIAPGHLEPVTRATNVQRGATSRLTPEAVAAIRSSDERLRVLAERYGVAITTVWQARHGLTWRKG